MSREEIPQFKTLEEEKAYWESKGPLGIEAQREEILRVIAEAILECPVENAGCDGLAQHILNKLHPQGVVIKVDRELPKNTVIENVVTGELYQDDGYETACWDMLKAGYSAWKPLI